MKFCDGIFKNVGDYEIKDEKVYKCTHICDLIHSNEAKVLAEYTSDFYKGRPALTRNSFGEGNAYYIASRNEDKFNFDFFSELIKEIGVERNIETELEDGGRRGDSRVGPAHPFGRHSRHGTPRPDAPVDPQVRNLRRPRQGGGRGRKAAARRAPVERGGLFRHRARKDSRGAGRARDRRDSDPDDRHRRRRGLRRPGARDPRHAGYQQRVLAALPAPLRRPAHGDDRCRGAVCQGCEGVRFPQRKGAVLVPDSLYTQAPAGTFQPGLALQKAKEGYLIVLCRAS